MDDKSSSGCARDCALYQSQPRDEHDGLPADVPCPPDCQERLSCERRIPTVLDERASAGGDGEPAGAGQAAADDPAASVDRLLPAQVIEALLFSSDTPLSAVRLAELSGLVKPSAVGRQIAGLNEKYARAGLSFRIEAIARGYQMMTLPGFRPWLVKLHKQHSESRLSPAALETLAIIAYKQPVIRAEIEAIRGVVCGEVITRLRDMGLVRVVGRAEVIGRPLLYGTTRKFLDAFGLADLDDLPPMEALELKSASKPVEEIEPVPPPALPQPQLVPATVVGA